MSDFDCDVTIRDAQNKNVLYSACIGGSVKLVQTLVKNGVGSLDDTGLFPLHTAAQHGHEALVLYLIEEFGGKSYFPEAEDHSVLHCACESGNVSLIETLIDKYEADVYSRNYHGQTTLDVAVDHGREEVATLLLIKYGWGRFVVKAKGDTLLHYACMGDNINLIETLIDKRSASTDAQNSAGQSPLHKAVLHGKEKVARLLITKYGCDVNRTDYLGNSVLHYACEGGHVSLVHDLLCHYKANVNGKNSAGDTPLLAALSHEQEVVARTLIKGFSCDVNVCNKANKSALHIACESNISLSLVQTILQEQSADVINLLDCDSNTPLLIAALKGKEVVLTLLIKCDASIRGHKGRTLLHCACLGKNVSLVQTLIKKYNFDADTQDDENNTPLHVAVLNGRHETVSALITEFGCDPNVRDGLGRSLLHLACSSKSSEMVVAVGKYVSPLVVDDNGDTPLHIACSREGGYWIVKAVLKLDPPVLLRNNCGKIASQSTNNFYFKDMIDKYITENHDKLFAHYDDLQTQAKKKYSSDERITRIFVIGNPGVGKSSLVETVKREGFIESFRRVAESSVPPHTAGIVPSIHTSKHYGRVLFYDFAGDPEYYSSHAAILENLVSSRKGDNLFIIVVDLREDSSKTREILYYWLSFIQHQKFCGREPSLILVGSHSDRLGRATKNEKRKELQEFCDHIQPGHGFSNKVVHFVLDCRNPKSKHIRVKLSASPKILLVTNSHHLPVYCWGYWSKTSAMSLPFLLLSYKITSN